MTNLYPNANITNTSNGMPGAAPVPGSALMTGNPNVPNEDGEFGVYPPGPQNTPSQLAATQISNGSIPLQTQPTNVNVTPGGTSLLALLSSGQVSLKDSNYGQPGALAPNPNGPSPGVTSTIPIATGPASSVTIANPPVYSGN